MYAERVIRQAGAYGETARLIRSLIGQGKGLDKLLNMLEREKR